MDNLSSLEVIMNWGTRHPSILFFVNSLFWRHTYRRVRRFVRPNDLVLDIGSSDAPYTRYLSNIVVAVDLPSEVRFGFTEDSLRKLRQFGRNTTLVCASIENLPFRNNSFDKIICTEVLEHVRCDRMAVKEMALVIKENGEILITTPNGDVLRHGIKEHLRHYTEEELNSLLGQSFRGTTIEKRLWLNQLYLVQDRYLGLWVKEPLRVERMLISIVASWIYEIVYAFSKFSHRGKINLVAISRYPSGKNSRRKIADLACAA